MPNLLSNTMALVGGAALGAAAMYLLDPDAGADRRKDIAGAAADAVGSTRDAVGTTAAGASDSAHGVAHTIAKYAKGLSDHLSDRADAVTGAVSDAAGSAKSTAGDAKRKMSDVIGSAIASLKAARDKVHDKASDWAGSASDAVSATGAQAKRTVSDAADSVKSTRDDWFDTAHDYADRARAAGRKALNIPEPHPVSHATGLTAGGLGVLAVGAALMYYMDPERGRSRRALLSDKAYSLTRQSGDKMRRYGHHLGNKAQGYVAEAKHVVPEQWVDKAKSVLGGAVPTDDGTH